MDDFVCRSLARLVGEYGPQLGVRPVMCERLLHECAPDHSDEVRVLIRALRHGARTPVLVSEDPEERARCLAHRAGLSTEQARWAIAVWKEALEGKPTSRPRGPFCPLGELAVSVPPEDPNPVDPYRLAVVGAGFGTVAGALAALVCVVLGEAAALARLAAAVPAALLALSVPCGIAGGAAVGALGGLVRLTRVPELLGGLAGAAVGATGGWVWAAWAGALFVPGTRLAEAQGLARTAASTTACLAAGALLGIFQDVLFRTLYKWFGRPPGDYSVLTGESVKKETNRRAGL